MNESGQAERALNAVPHERPRGDLDLRLRELEAQGVDLSLLAEQLRLTPTARIESMLRLRDLSAVLAAAGTRSAGAPPTPPADR
jgi:hypothetical protein